MDRVTWDVMRRAAASGYDTLAKLESGYNFGTLSAAEYRAGLFWWRWTAARMAGVDGARHDRAYARLGSARYWRRLERVRVRWLAARGLAT